MEKGRIGTIVITIILVLIALFLYTKIAGPIPFSVNSTNTNKTDLFEVSGIGKAAAAPDTAKITIGVIESAPNVLDAQEKVNSKAKNIIDGIKNLGVAEKNIKTTSYSVNPDYNFDKTQRITGYTVTQNLEIKSDISKINQVIDKTSANGANLAGGIEFMLNDDKMLELENKAREEAVQKAKRKAEGLAKASGIKLGKIVNVQESGENIPRPIFLDARSDKAQLGQPTNITPGENNVEVTVTLSYQIY